jgi:hypothetical protein
MQLFAKLDVLYYQRSEHLASARAQALYIVIDMLRKKAAVACGARQRGAHGVRAGLRILHGQTVQQLDILIAVKHCGSMACAYSPRISVLCLSFGARVWC